MPREQEHWVLGKQFLRCSTSVAANYRAACRARLRADFISKIGIVLEEADESVFWLELMMEAGTMSESIVNPCSRKRRNLLQFLQPLALLPKQRKKSSI
jgi:four helix bundle protein